MYRGGGSLPYLGFGFIYQGGVALYRPLCSVLYGRGGRLSTVPCVWFHIGFSIVFVGYPPRLSRGSKLNNSTWGVEKNIRPPGQGCTLFDFLHACRDSDHGNTWSLPWRPMASAKPHGIPSAITLPRHVLYLYPWQEPWHMPWQPPRYTVKESHGMPWQAPRHGTASRRSTTATPTAHHDKPHGILWQACTDSRPWARWYQLRGLPLVGSECVCPQSNSSFVIRWEVPSHSRPSLKSSLETQTGKVKLPSQ